MLELVRLSVLAAGLASALLAATTAAAEDDRPAVAAEVLPGPTLKEGDRGLLQVRVTGLLSGEGAPVMVTPQVVGEAVEALRGRLFRSDATLASDGSLRFDLPLLAKTRGSAEVVVSVVAFDCRARCRELTLRTRVSIDVRLP